MKLQRAARTAQRRVLALERATTVCCANTVVVNCQNHMEFKTAPCGQVIGLLTLNLVEN